MLSKKELYILGTPYTVYVGTKAEVHSKFKDIDSQGVCRFFSKEIVVVNEFEDAKADYSEAEAKSMTNETLMHELSHAFLYESGRVSDAENEELVEWLSVIIPKIFRAYCLAN